MTIVVRRRSIPSGSEAYQTESSVASAKRTSTLWTMKKTHLNQKKNWDWDNNINLFVYACLETIIFISIITIIIVYYHYYWYHLQLLSLLNTSPYHWNIDNMYIYIPIIFLYSFGQPRQDPTTREWRLDAKPAPSRVDYSDSQQAQVPYKRPKREQKTRIRTHQTDEIIVVFLLRNEIYSLFFLSWIFVWQVFLEDFFTY